MRVLVTGTKGKLVSYFRQYINKNKSDWDCLYVSLRNDQWREIDFSIFDAIIHCAGVIAVQNDDYEEFRKINVVKTEEVFAKAVRQRVKHFVYLSSMAIYDGLERGFGKDGLITQETKPEQKTNYGKSKFEAEKTIGNIKQRCTTVSIIRAPAIVGGGLEAYFDRYIQFSKIPVLPIPIIHLEAKRSFVYIDTLMELFCSIVENKTGGVFFPQNFPQLSVSEIIYEVCEACGVRKNMWRNAEFFMPGFLQRRYFSQICYDESLSIESKCLNGSITSREAIKKTVREICDFQKKNHLT